MIFLLNPSVFAATVTVSLTGLTTDSLGNYALNNTAIGYSVAGTVSSQKWQSSANGSVLSGDIGGATGTTFTPVIGSNVTNYHYIRVAVVISGTEYYSPWTQVANIPAVAGTPLDLSFTVGAAVSNINLLQNWTLNNNTVSSFTITGTLPTGITSSSTSSQVRLSGTPSGVTPDAVFTLTVFDVRGRPVSVTFNLEVTNEVLIEVPLTSYVLSGLDPNITSLSLSVTAENTLEATGSGNVTIGVTQPLIYQGTYTTDQSNEGASATFNFEALASAPMCVVKPTIARLIDADSSGTDTTGDTFVATPGLWVYDSDYSNTVSIAGAWALNGTPIGGATSLERLQSSAGNLTYSETVTGAGTTRSATSNTRAVTGAVSTISVPLTTYTLTLLNPSIFTGSWLISAGDASATINIFPLVPTSPAWNISTGDATALIIDYPGEL